MELTLPFSSQLSWFPIRVTAIRAGFSTNSPALEISLHLLLRCLPNLSTFEVFDCFTIQEP